MFSRVNAMLIFSTVIWAMISCLTACFAQPEENFPDPPSAGRPLTPAPAGRWQTYTVADGLPYPSIAAVAADTQGGVWVGTPQGAAFFKDNQWRYYREKHGLLSNLVVEVAIDQEGTVWFGTDKGVTRFDGITWTDFTEEDGLQSGMVPTISPDGSGGVWLAISGIGGDWAFGNGVARLDDGGTAAKYDDRWLFLPPTRERMAGGLVSAIVEVEGAGMWFGLTPEGTVRLNDSRGAIWQLRGYDTASTGDDQWQLISLDGNNIQETVTALVVDSAGDIWIGTPTGLLHLPRSSKSDMSYEQIDRLTTADGLPGDRILSLTAGPDNQLWIGTDVGLALLNNGLIKVYTTADGLPSNQIRDIALDINGSVWVATPSGVGRLVD